MTASHPEESAPASAQREDRPTGRAFLAVDIAHYFTPRSETEDRPALQPRGRGTYRERLRRGYGGRSWSK